MLYHKNDYFCPMKQITLSNGQFAQVDNEDFERLNKFRWFPFKHRNTTYAMRHKSILMHREIMNAQKGEQIDHKDRDGLNNTTENLRKATHAQNMANRKASGKSSKYLGVCWDKGKYRASLTTNNQTKELGRFVSEDEAGKAYNKGALKYHGEFANLNIIT